MIPREFVDEVIARTDIVEIVGGFVPLRKAGKEYVACCPFHNEKTPSFSVNRDKQLYYCFGCGASGNALSFLMEHARLDFVEAVADLAARLGLNVPHGADSASSTNTVAHREHQRLLHVLEQVAEFYARQLQQHPVAPAAREYLRQRGVEDGMAAEFRLGFAPPGWNALREHFGAGGSILQDLLDAGMISQNEQGNGYDRFRNRLMFPIYDARGRVIAFGGRILDNGKDNGPKYLNSPETKLFHKGRELYGLHRLRKLRPPPNQAVVVEGYMDVVGLACHGVHNAVATLGTATSTEHVNRLFRMTDSITFCFDGDNAGRTAAWRALQATLPALRDGRQIRFAFLPQGHDPDSLVQQQGAGAFAQYLAQAPQLSEFLFTHLQEQTDPRSLEGQAKLVELAQPLIRQVPESALRDLLLQRLAELARLPETRLRGRMELAGESAPLLPPALKTQRPAQGSGPSPMRTAVALLTQFPAMFTHNADLAQIPVLRLPGGDLLAELIEFIGQGTHIALNTAVILEHWRGSPHYPALQKLASITLWLESEESIHGEFYGAIERLQDQQRHLQLESLLQKAGVTELNEEERKLLLTLSRPSPRRSKA